MGRSSYSLCWGLDHQPWEGVGCGEAMASWVDGEGSREDREAVEKRNCESSKRKKGEGEVVCVGRVKAWASELLFFFLTRPTGQRNVRLYSRHTTQSTYFYYSFSFR